MFDIGKDTVKSLNANMNRKLADDTIFVSMATIMDEPRPAMFGIHSTNVTPRNSTQIKIPKKENLALSSNNVTKALNQMELKKYD
jgi:hypothetical protein